MSVWELKYRLVLIELPYIQAHVSADNAFPFLLSAYPPDVAHSSSYHTYVHISQQTTHFYLYFQLILQIELTIQAPPSPDPPFSSLLPIING